MAGKHREDDVGARLSIGALSRATGIAVETLRTWESRYGFPVLPRHRGRAPDTILPQSSQNLATTSGGRPRAPGRGSTRGTRVRLVKSSYCGRITESMTWMTPFEASTSALTTLAPLILTPLDVSILTIWPSTVFASLSFITSAAITLPGTTW